MRCRHCGAALTLPFVNLGCPPPSNAYLTADKLKAPEKRFPLRVLVCEQCWLVQTEDFARASELFDAQYAYFSGYSSTWLAHCERYVALMTTALGLGAASHVVEVATNDGHLLQYVKARNIPCTGIEPTASTAAAARAKGIAVVEQFFGVHLARQLVAQGKAADLIAANNVLAHVPDVNDFVAGFAVLLKPDGVTTFEFPHLVRLIADNQFDTIYHEHFSYLSLTAANQILSANGLSIIDVEEHPTHGGSLRIFAQRKDTGKRARTACVDKLLEREFSLGIKTPAYYTGFQTSSDRVRDDFRRFLLDAKRQGKHVAAYGAAAKGNTLMNYARVRADLIEFVADRNPAKQGRFMPGSHVPIEAERRLVELKPDYVVILPWNLKDEIAQQLAYIRAWGGRLVTAVPALEVLPP